MLELFSSEQNSAGAFFPPCDKQQTCPLNKLKDTSRWCYINTLATLRNSKQWQRKWMRVHCFCFDKQKHLVPCRLVVLCYARHTSVTVDGQKSSREEQQGTDDAIEFMAPCLLWRKGLVEVKPGCQEELHLLQTATVSVSSLLFCSGKEGACSERIKYVVVKDTGKKNTPQLSPDVTL